MFKRHQNFLLKTFFSQRVLTQLLCYSKYRKKKILYFGLYRSDLFIPMNSSSIFSQNCKEIEKISFIYDYSDHPAKDHAVESPRSFAQLKLKSEARCIINRFLNGSKIEIPQLVKHLKATIRLLKIRELCETSWFCPTNRLDQFTWRKSLFLLQPPCRC